MNKRVLLFVMFLALSFSLVACIGGGTVTYFAQGYVRDSAGKGLAGVELYFSDGSIAGPTESDGYWRRDDLKGLTTVTPIKPGWQFEPAQRTVRAEQNEAEFVGSKQQYVLDVKTAGEGTVQVEVWQEIGGEKVLAAAQDTYEYGTKICLTALPENGWSFKHWTGDLTSSANPELLTMDGTKEVTAVFWKGSVISGEIEVEHAFPASILEGGAPSMGGSAFSVWPGLEGSDLPETVIMFDGSQTVREQKEQLQQAGFTVLDSIGILNAHLVTDEDLDTGGKRGMQNRLDLRGVLYSGPNQIMRPLGLKVPNDPRYSQQWHYNQIRLPQAWHVTTGDSSIRVAVIDTGIDSDHPDLKDHLDLQYGYNFFDDNTDLSDTDGHGTHVAGTIGALTDNGLGVAGVMWDVTILPLKVFGQGNQGSSWNTARAILYAAGLPDDEEGVASPNLRPAQIANLSLGGGYCPEVEKAVELAAQTGMIIVAASGNNGQAVAYPAAYPDVIAVGAVDFADSAYPQRAYYSNYGPEIDLLAPGGDSRGILSTVPGKEYSYWCGTSMATPHVSGLIGLMLAAGVPQSEVRDVLTRTCMEISGAGFDEKHGYGLINAYWAVNAVKEMRIILGKREGNTVSIGTETLISPKGGNYSLSLEEPGEHQLIAWIDVNGNNIIDAGDYYGEIDLVSLEGGVNYTGVDVVVKEVGDEVGD